MTAPKAGTVQSMRGEAEEHSRKLYPECGCPPDHEDRYSGQISSVINLVCRNPDCLNYGAHVRGEPGDKCVWCAREYMPLRRDPFRGAR